ncbi:MAG: hypothetical protein LBN36_06295, partial [Clostridiales Family XIII bacterium]|nr:hypothetical protein [Clostridiales Family XIII bacterium]
VRAFNEILEIRPAEAGAETGWQLTAPDGQAYFVWRNDSTSLWVDSRPFVAAGLDLSKLENVNGDWLVFLSSGFDMLNENVESTAQKQFETDAKALRDSISYHTALDHYGISFGDGNMFEWAKDVSTNDKDIVFVLNPESLINAGVDPNAVEGWVFAKVPVEIDGKQVEVDKLLKPFDLK